MLKRLVSWITRTSGLVGPIRDALDQLELPPALAFVYGSVARAEDNSESDVDLILVGDALDYRSAHDAVAEACDTTDRQNNPTVCSKGEWSENVRNPDSFLGRVMDAPVIWVLGSEYGERVSGKSDEVPYA